MLKGYANNRKWTLPMKWRAVILLLFFSIVQNSTSWADKTTPFYVPPVMRLDLDPLQWELPYFQPWYFLAKSFEPHQMVEIKGRNFNLEIKFHIKYLTAAEEKNWAGYGNDYKVAKEVAAYKDFEPWQSRYIDTPQKEKLVWIYTKMPHMRIFITTNASVKDSYQVALTHEILDKIVWISPEEIDRQAGYPLKISDVNSFKNERQQLAKNGKSDPYASRSQEPPIKDWKYGFTYAAYHANQLEIAAQKTPSAKERAYALGVQDLAPWNLIDSMSVGSAYYGISDKSNTYFNKFHDTYYKDSPFYPYRSRKILSNSKDHSVCLLYNDSNSVVWHATYTDDAGLKIKKSVPPFQSWGQEGNFYKKNKLSASEISATTVTDQPNLLQFWFTASQPTDSGLMRLGKSPYFLDLRNDTLQWMSPQTYDQAMTYQLLVCEMRPEATSYSQESSFIINECQGRYSYATSSPDRYSTDFFVNGKAAYIERQQTKPADILVVCDLIWADVDADRFREAWKIWLSNGVIVHASGIEITDKGCQYIDARSYLEALSRLDQIQSQIKKSKIGYSAFTKLQLSDFEQEESELSYMRQKMDRTIEIPFVHLIDDKTGSSDWQSTNSAAMQAVAKDLKYPLDAKKAGLGGFVRIPVQIQPNGKAIALPKNEEDPAYQSLVKEAQRLVPLLPPFEKDSPANASVKENLVLLFYFQP
jgi:hypothetical protein